jgi:hypothetical protein
MASGLSRIPLQPSLFRPFPILLILLSILTVEASIGSVDGQLLTITAFSGFADVRPCVQDCLWWNPVCCMVPAAFHLVLACSKNSCLCRTDLGTTASSALSGCMLKMCQSNQDDINAGISIFNAYCDAYYSTAGTPTAAAAPTVTALVTTLATQTQAVGSKPTVTVVQTTTSIIVYNSKSEPSTLPSRECVLALFVAVYLFISAIW